MIKNYLKIALRSIRRHKSFSLLNILGLGLGMGCSILIFLWVADELRFDLFNKNAGIIYRITSKFSDISAAIVPGPVGSALASINPSVKRTTKLKATGSIFTIGITKFEEKNGFYADTNFLRMFNYPLVAGDPLTALSGPAGIVITETAARKYFGTVNAIGKTIFSDNNIKGDNLTVTGILKDIPAASHLRFDFLLPVSLLERTIDYDGSWGNFDMFTYIEMNNNFRATDGAIQQINAQLNEIYRKNEATKAVFFLQPLTSVHLGSDHLLADVAGQGSLSHVRIFSLAAIFILVIACINFMNLSTAMSGKRAKEVGLRKTIGASRRQLIAQFLGESVILSFVSLLTGITIAALLMPFFNNLTGKNISLQQLDARTVLGLFATALSVGLLAGSYPALVLSSFQPVKVLKGFKVLPGGKQFFRNGLVSLQFSISIILIISTLVVYNQLQFIRNRDIGFNKENLLFITMPRTGDLGSNYQALKATLNQYPGIKDYSVVNYLPVSLTTGTTDVIWPGKDPQLQVEFPHIGVDENFARTFGMKIVAGRFFSKDFQGDKNNYVVNEAVLKVMKMDPAKAIGSAFTFNGHAGQVIGVLKDFNFKPVQHAVEPLVVKYTGSGGNLVIRTTPATLGMLLPQVKKVFSNVYPNFPFTYGFVDEELAKLYQTEQRMSTLFNMFAVLSVIVSCLGLFGLATFNAQMRVREIGIRKVLGASVSGIVAMLSKDFMKPIIVAAFIAFPLGWWIMSQWLQEFAYRVAIGWWIFAIAGGIALVIAFATVSLEAIKAAIANPVNSLRSE